MRTVLNNTRGLTAQEIKERLEQIIPEYRARMIARTETVYAFKSAGLDNAQGQNERYNLGMTVEWRCQPGSKTCDVCAAMDGQTVPVGKAFKDQLTIPAGTTLSNGHYFEFETPVTWAPNQWNDQGTIPAPHPNCRCSYYIHIGGEE